MSVFATNYSSQGAGANYAFMTMGTEDDIFFDGATSTQWKQVWEKYTPHQAAMLQQSFQNVGLGKNNVCTLNKTPDFLYTSYLMMYLPAIRANVDSGVEECAWVNSAGTTAIRSLSIKIGNQAVFQIDGHQILALIELFGLLDNYKDQIGFSYTRNQQIADSKRDRYLFVPMLGLPFFDRPDTAFNIGSIAFHQVTCEVSTRPLSDMTINFGSGANPIQAYALPIEINTNAVISATSVDMALATNCVWVSGQERAGLIQGYNEIMFKEHLKAAECTVAATNSSQRVEIDVSIKGPCTYIFVTIQSQADLDAKNYTKLCQDTGLDYITEMMLITGSTAREDGLPAQAYRTLKVLESFKSLPHRHIYVLAFETDSTSHQMTGHQNFTNVDKIKFSALYQPHSSPLQVRVDAGVYNGVYTEKGSGGRIWG